MGKLTRGVAALAIVATLVASMATLASADGTETLGAPSVAVASGSGVAVGGVGLAHSQPEQIDVAVPAGASVEQVLLYWEGHHSAPGNGDGTAVIDGNPVAGTLIGGPTYFFTAVTGVHYTSTYRADITGLGLVAAGANSLSIEGLAFDRVNNGAGVLVIYDDGTTSEIGLVDGNDAAWYNFASPLDTTVAQTFTFAAEPVARSAELNMFFSSVEGDLVPGERPSTIEITVDGVVTELINVLHSNDGNEWDTISVSVNVPAGATSVTVQAISPDRLPSGNNPASFVWNAAALSVPVTPPPPPGGGEGCTPGYWKQRHHFDSWVGYAPGDDFEAIFGVDANFGAETLLEVLKQGGGGEKALGRHAVAALLNSATGGVSYEYSTVEVIALVQQAYNTGQFNPIKGLLETQNEMGCPLN